MEVSFLYEAKEQCLIIHLPKELDHHNCRNLRYETDLLLQKTTSTGLSLTFPKRNLWIHPVLASC